MLKKIILCVLIGGFFNLIPFDKPQAQTETESRALFYGGAKVLIGEPGSGKGAFFAIGYEINDNFVFWGKYDGVNKPGVNVDEIKGSLSIITDPLIGKSAGLFFRGDIGGAYVQLKGSSVPEENDWQFATFTDAGIYVDLDSEKRTRLWIGIGYHGIDTIDPIYCVNVGISIIPRTWPW